MRFLSACYAAEAKDLAAKVSTSLKKDLEQQQDYYVSLGGGKMDRAAYDKLVKEFIFRYNTARTRPDQIAADQMLESNLSGMQMKMMDDIRMSYSLLAELQQMESINSVSKDAVKPGKATDSGKVK